MLYHVLACSPFFARLCILAVNDATNIYIYISYFLSILLQVLWGFSFLTSRRLATFSVLRMRPVIVFITGFLGAFLLDFKVQLYIILCYIIVTAITYSLTPEYNRMHIAEFKYIAD